jgi:hypothetical protein
MHFHERLPWPMELSSRIDILGSGSSFKNLEHRLRMIRSQQLDYAEHGIDAPPELERLAKRALVIGDEMTTCRFRRSSTNSRRRRRASTV